MSEQVNGRACAHAQAQYSRVVYCVSGQKYKWAVGAYGPEWQHTKAQPNHILIRSFHLWSDMYQVRQTLAARRPGRDYQAPRFTCL